MRRQIEEAVAGKRNRERGDAAKHVQGIEALWQCLILSAN
jgi:hypothetical protein